MSTKGYLVDTTRCIGCRACQTACKQWNDLPAEHTVLDRRSGSLQNPATLSARTMTVVQYHEIEDDRAPGGLRYLFTKRQCMHCEEPACAAACPVTAIHKTAAGPVVYDADKCIGCRYCLWACPFGVPTAEWDSAAPRIVKCDMCYDRMSPAQPGSLEALPACVKTCPAGALQLGDREELLREAKGRIQTHPDKYVDHVYGEHEAGGTNVLYLASVPFADLGFPRVKNEPYPDYSKIALGAVPPAVIGAGALLAGVHALEKRRAEVAREEKEEPHPHFARLSKPAGTLTTGLLLALMAFGLFSFVARFVLGLGGATHLSDTHAWGLWILFDLVWIAVAAGAFASAGVIYVLQRKDLYSLGRAAVLMGLLSYGFVMVTLLADLGQPWHFYQLALQAPEHSAMFEVSWCVGLYVTVLLLEFLPVPFERWGLARAAALWRRYAPVYVVAAVSLFVWLLSRKLAFAGLALVVFGLVAWKVRTPADKKPEPILLAIAAVTFSTMHQSSLGSLFLLMPDSLDPLWWSPVMPVLFFLSSVASGLGLLVLVEMGMAQAWGRRLRVEQLASLGEVAAWALGIYLLARVADVAARGQLAHLFRSSHAALFLVELVPLGLLPLALYAVKSLRRRPALLGAAALLSTCGVILNRADVVVFAMTLRGPMPQDAASGYTPSVFEWGISIGLIAATFFLFGQGVRFLPVLPVDEEAAPAK